MADNSELIAALLAGVKQPDGSPVDPASRQTLTERHAPNMNWMPQTMRDFLAQGLQYAPLGFAGLRGGAPPAARASGPAGFMQELQSRDIPAGNSVMRWNPQQQWLYILRNEQPVGRAFVTPVNAKTGHISQPDSYILGPKVETPYQRQGIASSVYDVLADVAKPYGVRQVPGLSLSREAFDMWRKRDPGALASAMSRQGANGRLSPEQRAWLDLQNSTNK